jgi:hypothetical protein
MLGGWGSLPVWVVNIRRALRGMIALLDRVVWHRRPVGLSHAPFLGIMPAARAGRARFFPG